MRRSISAAILAMTLMSSGSIVIGVAAAAPARTAVQQPQAGQPIDFSARRPIRHHARYAQRAPDRPDPSYADRPHHYAPAPYVPFNFGAGFGW